MYLKTRHSSACERHLHISEDNEAVIRKRNKDRSPAMRHTSRAHRVDLDCLYDRIN